MSEVAQKNEQTALSVAAQAPTDKYAYWRNALAGNFDLLPAADDDAQPGFYRKRKYSSGPFVPVAIWERDGNMVAMVENREVDAGELWIRVSNHPVTEESYRAKMAGNPWPDEDTGVAESLKPASLEIGANEPPKDKADILKEKIDAASANSTVYKEISDDETASKAQSARSRLLELSNEAVKKHDKEKEPHLDAGRAVDKRWFPLRDTAKAAADSIRTALTAHERRKDAERTKAESAHLAAIAEAERVRIAAEEAGKPAPEPEPIPEPLPPPPPQTAIKGAYGRAASIKMVKVVTVTDQDAAYGFLKTHKEMKELIAALAKRAVIAGLTVPGTVVTEEKDIR